MARRWPIGLQFVIFAALVAGSVGVWFGRDAVTEALASLRVPSDGAKGEQSGRRGGRNRGSRRALPVIVASASSQTNDVTIARIGTARARRAVMITSNANGEIVKFPVKAGERVKQGTTLFVIDDTQARLALEIARKQVEDAQRKLERSAYLKRRAVNSAAPVEDAENALRRARLELKKAEKTLSDLTVAAPFDGIVGIPKVEVGDRVTSSSQIISLDDRSELLVEFTVPEQLLPRIKIGDKIKVTTPGYGDRVFSGSIRLIDSRIDPASRSVTVRASVPNVEDLLRPGMSFSISVTLPGKQYTAVPELALQWDGRVSYVWRIEDKRAKRVRVRAVRRMNKVVLVEGGIKPGHQVVVEGVQRLRPNRTVSIGSDDDDSAGARNKVRPDDGARPKRTGPRAEGKPQRQAAKRAPETTR